MVSTFNIAQRVAAELDKDVCNLHRSRVAIVVDQNTQDDVHDPAPEATSATSSISDDRTAPETEENVSISSSQMHHNIR